MGQVTFTQVFIKITIEYQLELCIYEALSNMHGTMETVFVGVAINYQ